jgi:hypothetical protein
MGLSHRAGRGAARRLWLRAPASLPADYTGRPVKFKLLHIIRLIGAVLLDANDEWQMQHRYMGVEALGEMLNPPNTNETLQLLPKAA